MKHKFYIQEIEIDAESLSHSKRLLLTLYSFIFAQYIQAINRLIKAIKNDYPTPLPKQLFTEKSNFIFNEMTYHRSYSFFKKMFQHNDCEPSIIYLNNIIILFSHVRENFSENKIKKTLQSINQTTENLSTKNNIYYTNNRGFRVKLLNSTRAKIHRIIIQTQCDNASSENNSYFISDANGIIHIFNTEDYYFVINHLLTPTELHHYLCFRSWLCERKSSAMHAVSEAGLLGQYLMDNKEDVPNNKYAVYSKNLDMGLAQWEMLLSSLYKSTVGISKRFEKEYYFILSRIAKLRIDELILLRDTFISHYENIFNKNLTEKSEVNVLLPFGFVFIEHWQKDSEKSAKKYELILNAYRYQHQLTQCIAIIFTPAKTSKNKSSCEVSWWVMGGEQLIDE